jgi:ethanolamine utilization microcompartment shell protein EutS
MYIPPTVNNEMELCEVSNPDCKSLIERALLQNRISYYIRWPKTSWLSRRKNLCIICVNENATGEAEDIKALGIIETINAVSSITVADAAVKAANVKLLEVRMARGLGGKAFVILTGEVQSVKTAVKAAEAELAEAGVITSYSVLPRPHKDIRNVIF